MPQREQNAFYLFVSFSFLRGAFKTKSMVNKLKHKWKGTNICVRCGCERINSKTGTYYSRSNHFSDNTPDCIDWDVENAKTID